MVMVLEANVADTPAGKPLTPVDTPSLDMPVAPVVVWVILVRAVLIQSIGVVEAALAVLVVITVIVPVALTELQPPVNGML